MRSESQIEQIYSNLSNLFPICLICTDLYDFCPLGHSFFVIILLHIVNIISNRTGRNNSKCKRMNGEFMPFCNLFVTIRHRIIIQRFVCSVLIKLSLHTSTVGSAVKALLENIRRTVTPYGKNVFISFFPRIYAFYEALRFKSFADNPFYSIYFYYQRTAGFFFLFSTICPSWRCSNIRPEGRADGHKVHPYIGCRFLALVNEACCSRRVN